MLKKIIGIMMSLMLIMSVCAPFSFAAEVTTVTSGGETKVLVTSYSNVSVKTSVKSDYMQYNGGDWIEFLVNFPKSGKYDVSVYACAVLGKEVKATLASDSVTLTQGIIPLTNSSNDYKTVSTYFGTFYFEKGVHAIKLTNGGGSAHLGGVAFIASVDDLPAAQIEKQSGAYKEAYLPTVINAENFDVGAGGYKSADGKNAGGKYRPNDGIDIAEESGNYVVTLNKGEFVNYTFNVVKDDVYCLNLKASGQTNLEAYFDDYPYPVNIGIDAISMTTLKGTDIYLKEGTHTLKLAGAESAVKLDELIFTVSDSEEYIGVESLVAPQPKSTMQASDDEEVGFDYSALDKANEVYKEIYISENGSDEADGSKGAPFKTFERVLTELEAITPEMTGDIIINVASGYYGIEETVNFTELHGGKNGFNVIIKGENGEEKPVISGGVKITGWEQTSDYIWKAPVLDDEIKHVRNLYVNDYPSIRARTKYIYQINDYYVAEGSANRRDGLYVDAANFPKVERPETMEMVCENVWALNRFKVEDILYAEDGGQNIMLLKNPTWSRFGEGTEHSPRIDTFFYLENAKEFLDEPGEFYFDDVERMIYYYPYKAEDMKNAETYIGKTEGLFNISGTTKETKTENIVIDNLSFKHGAWDYVSEEGMMCYQSDVIQSLEGGGIHTPEGSDRCAPGQVKATKAKNITIKNCEFTCLGASALDFEDAVQNVKVEGNVIRDISGAGMMIGTANHAKVSGSMEKINGETCRNFLVQNNIIRRTGNEYGNQAAISVYYEADITITHNDISEVPYTGITAGWGWSDKPLKSDEHKNVVITHNKISHVLRVSRDGGHVYTLGHIPGGVIAYNYMKDSHDLRWGGLYNDSGSSYIELHHNVLINNPMWYVVSSGYGARQNKAYQNYSDQSYWWTVGGALADNTVEEAIPLDPYNILPEAQAIIDVSGVSPKYRYLLDDIELPIWRKDRSTDRAKETFGTVGDIATYGWIEAENFMPGKNGETYYKKENVLNNNSYRSEGVSLTSIREFSGICNGYIIQNVFQGEWMKYKLLAPVDGEYQIKLRYSHGSKTPLTFNLYIDDELVLDACGIEKGENGWFHMVERDCGTVNLTAGEHIVKFEYIGGFYLDALGFIHPDVPIEETIELTSPDYDEGVLELEQEPVIEYEFLDIDGHWAQRDIIEMQDAGIINGISPTEFAPDKYLTREQAVWICMRTKGIYHTMETWEDVAIEYGMISEKGNGNEIISREEFAHIMMKANGAKKYTITMGKDYNDVDEISEKYYDEVLGARELGLMSGDENNNFRPKDGLTRAEAITVAKRLIA